MATESPTKDSLTWFHERRARWKNAPRNKVVALSPNKGKDLPADKGSISAPAAINKGNRTDRAGFTPVSLKKNAPSFGSPSVATKVAGSSTPVFVKPKATPSFPTPAASTGSVFANINLTAKSPQTGSITSRVPQKPTTTFANVNLTPSKPSAVLAKTGGTPPANSSAPASTTTQPFGASKPASGSTGSVFANINLTAKPNATTMAPVTKKPTERRSPSFGSKAPFAAPLTKPLPATLGSVFANIKLTPSEPTVESGNSKLGSMTGIPAFSVQSNKVKNSPQNTDAATIPSGLSSDGKTSQASKQLFGIGTTASTSLGQGPTFGTDTKSLGGTASTSTLSSKSNTAPKSDNSTSSGNSGSIFANIKLANQPATSINKKDTVASTKADGMAKTISSSPATSGSQPFGLSKPTSGSTGGVFANINLIPQSNATTKEKVSEDGSKLPTEQKSSMALTQTMKPSSTQSGSIFANIKLTAGSGSASNDTDVGLKYNLTAQTGVSSKSNILAPGDISRSTIPTKTSAGLSSPSQASMQFGQGAAFGSTGKPQSISSWKPASALAASSGETTSSAAPTFGSDTKTATSAISSGTEKEEDAARDSSQTSNREPAEVGDDHRTRLVDFYTKHNPEKLDSVDSTLAKFKGKEVDLFRKLEAKYASSKYPLPFGGGPTCFLEFKIEDQPVGKVVVKLYHDKVPLACENFRYLCSGEKGMGRSGKPLCYKFSKVHRVVPQFCVQLGDFTRGDGTGGESIYGPQCDFTDSWGKFKDESFMQHSKKGLLSMANNGPNRNGSQFFFTLHAVPYLDGKHVVFGEVVSGMDVIEKIGQLDTDKKQRPKEQVVVSNCGEIVDGKEVDCQYAGEDKSTVKSTPFGVGLSSVAPSSSPFGLRATGSTTKPFGLGGASTGGAATSSANPFTFGSSGAATQPSPFSFGASAASSKTAPNEKGQADGSGKSNQLTFGSTASNLQFGAPKTGGPVFGAPSDPPKSTTSPQSLPLASASGPVFGGTKASASVFGSSTIATTGQNASPASAMPVFGAASSTSNPFTFGSASALPSKQPVGASTAAGSKSPFSFGGSTAGQSGEKTESNAVNFSFGGS